MKYEIAKPTDTTRYYLLIEHRPTGDAVSIRSAFDRDAFVHRLLDEVKSTADDIDGIDQDDPEILSSLDDLAAISALVAAFIREGR